MSNGQYRALIAYLNYWKESDLDQDIFEVAMLDLCISEPRKEVEYELWKCGWIWCEASKTLVWEG